MIGLVAISFFLSRSPAVAGAPYIGAGFENGHVYTSTAVQERSSFSTSTSPTGLTGSEYLGAPVTVAGTSTGSCCSGSMYQNAPVLKSDGTVWAAPQYWYLAPPPFSPPTAPVWISQFQVGNLQTSMILSQISFYDSNHVQFLTQVCQTPTDCANGVFTTYTRLPTKDVDLGGTTDTRFLVGNECFGPWWNPCKWSMRYLQFGIESGNGVIDNGGYQVKLWDAAFLSGASNVYLSADGLQGSYAPLVYFPASGSNPEREYNVGNDAWSSPSADTYSTTGGHTPPGQAIFHYCFLCGFSGTLWPEPTRAASFVSWTPPSSTMGIGQIASVSVTMKNTGTTPWTQDEKFPYRLGSQNPQDNTNWGPWRVNLAYDVAPGSSYTFTWTITAPSAVGTYNFQWRMLEEQVAWFGDSTPNLQITVTSGGGGGGCGCRVCGCPTGPSSPPPILTGSLLSLTFLVTLVPLLQRRGTVSLSSVYGKKYARGYSRGPSPRLHRLRSCGAKTRSLNSTAALRESTFEDEHT